jgi:hypothetical protein
MTAFSFFKMFARKPALAIPENDLVHIDLAEQLELAEIANSGLEAALRVESSESDKLAAKLRAAEDAVLYLNDHVPADAKLDPSLSITESISEIIKRRTQKGKGFA